MPNYEIYDGTVESELKVSRFCRTFSKFYVNVYESFDPISEVTRSRTARLKDEHGNEYPLPDGSYVVNDGSHYPEILTPEEYHREYVMSEKDHWDKEFESFSEAKKEYYKEKLSTFEKDTTLTNEEAKDTYEFYTGLSKNSNPTRWENLTKEYRQRVIDNIEKEPNND